MRTYAQFHNDIASRVFEVQRFTEQEHASGETAGWRFEVGWFQYVSGLEWAWFSRELAEWKP